MSIALIVTRGYGNGTLLGIIGKVVTMGYDISTIIPSTIPVVDGVSSNQSTGDGISSNQSTGNGIISNQSLGDGVSGSGSL